MHRLGHYVTALVLASYLALVSGCAETADNARGLFVRPWDRKKEEALNVKTPAKRIEELKVVAKGARKLPRDDQDRMSQELAREIQTENDPAVRRQILRTLGSLPTPMATAVLTAGLQDSDMDVRVVACQSLGNQGTNEAVSELARTISSDTNFDVRIAAVRAMGQTHNPATLPHLAEVLEDPDPALQFRVKESLRTISGKDYGDDVEAWQQYAKSGATQAAEVSFAERVKRYFR